MKARTGFRIPGRLVLPLLASVAFVPACVFKDKEKDDGVEKKERPRLIGRVASIPAGREFVLVQSYGKWEVETGAILTTQGSEGRAANLRSTGERLGQFAAADIQSGNLEIGDGVYSTVTPPPPAPAPASAEPAPAATAEAAGVPD